MLLYQDNSSDSLTGRNLLNVLNNRASSSAATRPVTRTRVLATASSAGCVDISSNIYTVLVLYLYLHSSGSDDGSSGPPMPYSFRYNVAGDETGTYMAREEESDGTTVLTNHSSPHTRAHF